MQFLLNMPKNFCLKTCRVIGGYLVFRSYALDPGPKTTASIMHAYSAAIIKNKRIGVY